MIGIIYKTTNLLNSKIYVGQTIRKNSNYLGSGELFKKIVKKYGRKNFIRETLCECNTYEELNTQEVFWIDKLNSRNKKIGYNIAKGGFNTNHSIESIKKMKESHKNISDETRKKISDAKKEFYKNNPNFQKGENHPMFGKHFSTEHKQKISNSTKGEKSFMFGKHLSDETKKKIGEKSSKKVYQYDLQCNFIKEYNSVTDAAKQNELFSSGISYVCRNNNKTCGGFIWKYKEII